MAKGNRIKLKLLTAKTKIVSSLSPIPHSQNKGSKNTIIAFILRKNVYINKALTELTVQIGQQLLILD